MLEHLMVSYVISDLVEFKNSYAEMPVEAMEKYIVSIVYKHGILDNSYKDNWCVFFPSE